MATLRHRDGGYVNITDNPVQSQILADAVYERRRQIQKWGPQRHPDIVEEPDTAWGQALEAARRAEFAGKALAAKKTNDRRAAVGQDTTWADIWLEEIYEALESDNPADLRKELIESIAVAVAWVEDLDTRGDG